MDTEDLTQPVSESFLHLTQDVDDISDSSVKLNAFDTGQLMDLVKQFDQTVDNGKTRNNNDDLTINDDTEIELIDSDNDLLKNIHSTPIIRNNNYRKSTKPTITVEELAQLIQPLLKEEFKGFKENIKQLLSQNVAEGVQQRGEGKKSEIESDDESAIHLESDHIIHSGSEVDDSPVTTPPNSSGTAARPNSSGTTKPEYLNLRSSQQEINFLKQQIKNLTNFNDELKLQNTRLTKNGGVDELKLLNNQLILKLNDSKLYNQELRNEINYLKTNKDIKINQLIKEVNGLIKEIGNKQNLLTSDTLGNEDFKPFFNQLHCDKVDNLTKVEMSNLIKNIMLTLLIDYDGLPENLIRISKFFKVANKFLDQTHGLVYENELKPSFYFKNNDTDDLNNFQTCLNDMYELVKQCIEASEHSSI